MENKRSLSLRTLTVLLGLLVPLFVSCSEGQTEDRQSASSLRVVSLVPSLTQEMYDLGTKEYLVGCTSFCEPAIADSVEVVASAMKIGVERILTLKPDLVLTSDLIDDKELQMLRTAGIRIENFPTPKTFQEVCSEFKRLGEVLQKKTVADSISQLCQNRVALVVHSQEKNPSSPRMLLQIGVDPIWVVTKNMYMCDFINLLNGKNIASELNSGAVNSEFVLSQNPEYIFVTSMGNSFSQKEHPWSSFASLDAVKNNRVFIIDASKACQPTPLNFADVLEKMAALIQ